MGRRTELRDLRSLERRSMYSIFHPLDMNERLPRELILEGRRHRWLGIRQLELDATTIEDLICGCGLPGGEQGHNIGRVISILSRLDVPGVTVNRYCSSSLMTTRMATHAIEAGEGDVFLSVGVECVSRYGSGYPDAPDTYNPKLVPGNADEYPDIYIAIGQPPENVAAR